MPADDFGRDIVPQWPEIAIPSEARHTVENFYRLVDTETEEAFQQWTHLFVRDGLVEINLHRVQGHDG